MSSGETKFLPATKASPKEMLPIVDKPLIQYAVEEAIAAGATKLVFVTGASKRAIEEARRLGVDLLELRVRSRIAGDLSVSDRKITVEEIQRKVSDHYNIRLSDLIGPKRVRTFARPRQVAMYLAKTMTSRSLPEIGRRFGGRDHTTIMHGVRKIEELKQQDSQIADDLELLRRSLEA